MSKKNVNVYKPVQPTGKRSRGDILHEQMILRGELQEARPQLNRKKFLIVSLIILALIAAATAFSFLRVRPLDDKPRVFALRRVTLESAAR